MGSPLRLTITRTDARTAAKAWSEVVAEFDAVDLALSGYRAESGISRLNAAIEDGKDVAVEHRLYLALALCCRAWRATGGRFDPRVLIALQHLDAPGPPPIAVPPLTDPTVPWLVRNPRRGTVRLTCPLDLHGIGKGLALRWARRRLERSLAPGSGFLLEAGGDLVARSPGPAEPAWLLAVEDPRDGPQPLAVVALRNGALCTSSTRLAHWVDASGRAAHHLIDPTTGLPGGAGLLAVTVASRDPAWTEVRTKELFLAGSKGIAGQARRRDLPAWWVTSDGVLEMTAAARVVTRWP